MDDGERGRKGKWKRRMNCVYIGIFMGGRSMLVGKEEVGLGIIERDCEVVSEFGGEVKCECGWWW